MFEFHVKVHVWDFWCEKANFIERKKLNVERKILEGLDPAHNEESVEIEEFPFA